MVKDELSNGNHKNIQTIKKIIEKMDQNEQLDLFGGEPILYPDFWEVIEYAHQNKLKITLATNCRLFSKNTYIDRIKKYDALQVRTSLYGHNAEIHDYYTNIPGSFRQTLEGISNLTDIDKPPLVNILILEKNVAHLYDLIGLLFDNGVRAIKLSSLYGGPPIADMLVDYETIRKNIIGSLFKIGKKPISIQIEKTPFCVAPHFINLFIPETDPKMHQASRKYYKHPEICDNCKLRSICQGILKEYEKKYGIIGIQPFNSIPAYAIKSLDINVLEEYRPSFSTEFLQISGCEDFSMLQREELVQNLKNRYQNIFIINNNMGLE